MANQTCDQCVIFVAFHPIGAGLCPTGRRGRLKRREGSRHEAWRELNGLVVCDKRSLNNYDMCISPQSPLKDDCVEAPHLAIRDKILVHNGVRYRGVPLHTYKLQHNVIVVLSFRLSESV